LDIEVTQMLSQLLKSNLEALKEDLNTQET